MGDAAEGDDELQPGEGFYPCFEEGAALVYLRADGFVLRRHTADGIGDHAVFQGQAIVRSCLIIACCKTEFDQGRVEEIASVISGEGAAGSVCAFQPWGKADDQELRCLLAERGDGTVEPAGLFGAAFLPEGGEAGAEGAISGWFCNLNIGSGV